VAVEGLQTDAISESPNQDTGVEPLARRVGRAKLTGDRGELDGDGQDDGSR
jgi:hypothetical protein